jgi:hypothetical protein
MAVKTHVLILSNLQQEVRTPIIETRNFISLFVEKTKFMREKLILRYRKIIGGSIFGTYLGSKLVIDGNCYFKIIVISH